MHPSSRTHLLTVLACTCIHTAELQRSCVNAVLTPTGLCSRWASRRSCSPHLLGRAELQSEGSLETLTQPPPLPCISASSALNLPSPSPPSGFCLRAYPPHFGFFFFSVTSLELVSELRLFRELSTPWEVWACLSWGPRLPLFMALGCHTCALPWPIRCPRYPVRINRPVGSTVASPDLGRPASKSGQAL